MITKDYQKNPNMFNVTVHDGRVLEKVKESDLRMHCRLDNAAPRRHSRVEVEVQRGMRKPVRVRGVVMAVNEDETYDILREDGVHEERVESTRVFVSANRRVRSNPQATTSSLLNGQPQRNMRGWLERIFKDRGTAVEGDDDNGRDDSVSYSRSAMGFRPEAVAETAWRRGCYKAARSGNFNWRRGGKAGFYIRSRIYKNDWWWAISKFR